MAQQFSKQSLRDLSKAVSRYNSMRTKFLNKNMPSYLPPKASVADIKVQSLDTFQLRQMIKQLNDYKTLEDFNIRQGLNFHMTQGEYRTFSRMQRMQNARDKKAINALKAERALSSTTEKRQREITEEIASLMENYSNLNTIRTRTGMQAAIKTFQKKEYLREKNISDIVSKDHYIASMNAIGFGYKANGKMIMDKISRMNERQFQKWMNSNQIYGLNYIYDMGVSLDSKINQIAGRIGMDISSDELQ